MSNKRRLKLWAKSPYCEYCNVHLNLDDSTLDHVFPRKYSKKKKDDGPNTVLCCKECNSLKDCMKPEKWWRVVEYINMSKWHYLPFAEKKKLVRSIRKINQSDWNKMSKEEKAKLNTV